MKFSVKASDLKRALNTCNEIAPGSSAITEEKTGVLISAKDNSATFMSSDQNLATRVEVPAEVSKPGEALVKCSSVAGSVSATFHDFGSEDEPNLIKLEKTTKGTLKVSGSNIVNEGKVLNHVRNFPLLDVGFFIETPEFNSSEATDFPVFQFMDGLTRVSHAASRDNSKSKFNCISLTLTDDNVIFAATDGTQIAEFKKAADVQGLRGSFVLGLKFAALAAKLANPTFDNVQIYVKDNKFFLRSGKTVLVGSLINDTFPDYEDFVQFKDLEKAVFPREAFLSVIQGMQPTVDAKSHRLAIDAKKSGTATLSTSSVAGEAESSDLEVKISQNIKLYFDSLLLQTAVHQLKGEDFNLYFSTDQDYKGVLLKSPKDDDFKQFVCTLKEV